MVAAGRTVSPSTLIDGLWGEDPPRTAGKSLQNVVLRVRKAFEPERSLVVTEMSGYRLAVEQVIVDAHRFEALAGAGDLREALALWRGAAYAGLEDSPVLAAEARRLEELRAAGTRGAGRGRPRVRGGRWRRSQSSRVWSVDIPRANGCGPC